MKLKAITSEPTFTKIKTDLALFRWLMKYMHDHSRQRLYPKALVDVADFIIESLPNGIKERDLVKAFDPGRINKTFSLPTGSSLSTLFQLTADTSEQRTASEGIIEFISQLLPELILDPPSLNEANMCAIKALGLWEYGAFRLAHNEGGACLITTQAGQAALNIKVAVEFKLGVSDEEW